MDPLALAFGTALVGAIATSAWQQASDAVAQIWRSARPHESERIEGELGELREHIVQARDLGDTATEAALEGAWQVKMQALLRAAPTLATELQRVMDEVLTPWLNSAEQIRIGTIIMKGSSRDSSSFNQIGIRTQFHRQ